MVQLQSIRQLDLLFYPFGYDSVPQSKLKVWLKLIEKRAKHPDTLFIVVNHEAMSMNSFSGEEKNLIERLFALGREKLGRRFVVFKEPNLWKVPADFFSKRGLSFSKNVYIKAYGKHAGNCVDKGLGSLMPVLKRISPKTNFSPRILLTPSEVSTKAYAGQLLKTIQRKRPDLLTAPEAKVLVGMYADAQIPRRSILRQITGITSLREIKQPRRRAGKR